MFVEPGKCVNGRKVQFFRDLPDGHIGIAQVLFRYFQQGAVYVFFDLSAAGLFQKQIFTLMIHQALH